jgi:hypothetical protein
MRLRHAKPATAWPPLDAAAPDADRPFMSDSGSGSASDAGRKRLQDLAKVVREKVAASGDTVLHRKGLVLVEMLARDLSAPDGMPGLKLFRDAPSKFHVVRGERNAEIGVEWQRDIGAAVMTAQKFGEPKKMVRYVYDEPGDRWRRMEGEGEIYDDLVSALVEYLYPEGK